ncbi:PKD domain-containing protein, partial [Steroidobacter sp.]|uniref:PKD domain-containing protein n=1 Tax=Steroidobacter sp. TaxID=1978227 RepID=UPI001A3CDA49
MHGTTRSRVGRKWGSWLGGITLLAMAPLAQAIPPSFNGTVNVPLPAIGQNVIVNLRQAGAVTGSAPILINTGQGNVILNANPALTSGLTIQPFDPVVGNGATVCVRITNVNYSTTIGGVLTAQLTATNALQETGATGFPGIVLNNAAGPGIVIEGNAAQEATCEDPNQVPVVSINGGNRTVSDTDGVAGENVAFSANVTDPEGELVTYAWYLNNDETPVSTSPAPTIPLPDGTTQVRLFVTDASGETGNSEVTVTVGNAAGPTANAGGDRTVADTDNEAGEDVILDGSLSTDADGAIATYRWTRIVDGETQELLGTSGSPTLQVRLPDGENFIQLVVTDNAGLQSSDSVIITVADGPLITSLSDIPNLTPNQRRVAVALDRICSDLRDLSSSEESLTNNQQELLVRCNGLQTNNSTGNQVAALEELVADDFAVARTQTLLFANTQYASVMDRLMALRGGAKGLSLAGLNIIVDGKMVPLAQLQEMAKGLLGGGASADEPGGLLSDKWGMWARGNFSFGEKDRSASSP